MVKYLLQDGRRVIDIVVRARCHPTEDCSKVAAAIKSLFPDAAIEGTDNITAVSQSIDDFGRLLREFRIRDAARGVMLRGLAGDTTRFRINKQVAAVGKISFAEEDHPLGDLEVEITSDDIRGLIDGIAPGRRRPRR